MKGKKWFTKKKAASIAAAVLVLALLITGTFAWYDYNQHKTNDMNGTMPKYDVRLVEDFEEVKDWKTTDPAVTKEIRVTNVGKASDGFGDVYVRIQLKEYMEIAPITYTQTAQRYMIDTEGYFIVFPTQEAAQAAYPGHVVANLTDAVTGTTGWFIQTKEDDPNGQYGKFVVTDIQVGTAESLVPGVERADKDAEEKHQEKPNGECLYTIHTWDDVPEDCGLDFHTYIKWILGDDIISLTDWIASGSQPVEKWIYDDTNVTDPWVYWGMPLEAQNDTNDNPNSVTSNLLEKVELIVQPEGSFYYAIHTELEAVSIHELGGENPKWTDAPQEIIDSYINNIPSIKISAAKNAIDVGEELQLNATVTPAGQTVTWTTSNSGVATVDADGKVTGVAYGTVTITAEAENGKTATYTIKVTPPSATGITINGDDEVTLEEGNTYKPGVTIEPANAAGTPTWSSNNTSVATVAADGTITAVGEGEAVITVSINGITDSITVKVTGSTLAVKYSEDGYYPVTSTTDADMDMRAQIYSENGNPVEWFSGDIPECYGYFYLEDILEGTDYTGLTITPVDSKYNGLLSIGTVKLPAKNGNKTAIVSKILPDTAKEIIDGGGIDAYVLPVEVVLTQGTKSVTITLNLKYMGLIDDIWS